MMVLITYDIDTTQGGGAKRLRKVAKICVDYGVRVQNSVFECVVDAAEYVILKNKLLKVYDEEKDSLRFYRLGEKYDTKIEHYGAKPAMKVEDVLIM